MKTKILYLGILFSTLLPGSISLADTQINIDYDRQTDVLELKIREAYLDDVLQQLSEQVGFKLSYDEDIHRLINIEIQDTSKKVIETLVKPNSVILSQADTSPHNVTGVILLPTGMVDSSYLPKKSLEPPTTSNPDKYKNHNRHYQKKLNQLEQGEPSEPRERPVPLYRKTAPEYKASKAEHTQ